MAKLAHGRPLPAVAIDGIVPDDLASLRSAGLAGAAAVSWSVRRNHGDAEHMKSILAASGVVIDAEGRLLLVLRTKDPEAGRWTVPGGSVDPGESLEEAAAREVFEETGIIVHIKHEVWSLTLPAAPGAVYEIHDFLAEPVAGTLCAGDDAGDAKWFSAQELEQAPLTHDLLGYLQRAGLYPPQNRVRTKPIDGLG